MPPFSPACRSRSQPGIPQWVRRRAARGEAVLPLEPIDAVPYSWTIAPLNQALQLRAPAVRYGSLFLVRKKTLPPECSQRSGTAAPPLLAKGAGRDARVELVESDQRSDGAFCGGPALHRALKWRAPSGRHVHDWPPSVSRPGEGAAEGRHWQAIRCPLSRETNGGAITEMELIPQRRTGPAR